MKDVTYEHKGVKITLHAGSGEFSATVSGQQVFKPSLAAMKKLIDTGIRDKGTFDPPLQLLRLHPVNRGKNGYERRTDVPNSKRPIEHFLIKVIRVKRDRSRYGPSFDLEFEGGERVWGGVYADTPENRENIIAYWKTVEANEKLKAEGDEREVLAKRKLVSVGADALAKGKGLT